VTPRCERAAGGDCGGIVAADQCRCDKQLGESHQGQSGSIGLLTLAAVGVPYGHYLRANSHHRERQPLRPAVVKDSS
jgi:hypothetical protein